MAGKKKPAAAKSAAAAPDGAKAPDGGYAEAVAELRELKEKHLADRLELQVKIMNGELVLCDIFKRAFGDICAVFTSVVFPMGLGMGDLIAAIIGESDKALIISRCMESEAYAGAAELRDNVIHFVEEA